MDLNKVIIIAEAGVNHNGDLNNAFKLVDIAKGAGADYVKFQTFKTEELVSEIAQKAAYQIENTGNDESQYAMLKKLELSIDDHHKIIAHCNKVGIKFLSSAFDMDSVHFLKTLNLGLWKIPSGEITNKIYLELIGSYNEPTILSTGMSSIKEIEEAILVLYKAGLAEKNLIVLHCTSDYPTSMKDVNLNAMLTIKNTFHVNVGYSDHTIGNEVAIGAVALGAVLLEKHFTIDKTMEGPDHVASLDPDELKSYVAAIRNISQAMGNSEKVATERELETIKAARKSIHYKEDLKVGTIIDFKHLVTKRPGFGISPMQLDSIVGKSLNKNIEAGTMVNKEDLI